MSSTSIAIASIRTAAEPVTIEDIGREIVRWDLVVVLTWIGAMKFTAYEAMGIQPLVAHSPLVSWMYDFLSIRSFSALLGCIEITTSALLGLRYVSPIASAAGNLLAIGPLRHHPLFSAHDSRVGTHLGWLSRAVSNARTIPAQGHRIVRRLSVVLGRVSQGHRGMTPSVNAEGAG